MRRTLVTAAAAVAVTMTTAAPATSVDMSFSKSSGAFAFVDWLEMGPMPEGSGVPGNAHFGNLYVQDVGGGRAAVYGNVVDVQCEDGVTPYLPGGHHGGEIPPGDLPEPPEAPAEGCTFEGMRFMEGEDLSFSVDRKLNRATLTGALAVSDGHGGPASARPPVKITWSGVGGTRTDRNTGTSVDEYGSRYTYRYTETSRSADIAAGSLIGPMIFDDESGEYSTSTIGHRRSMDRFRR